MTEAKKKLCSSKKCLNWFCHSMRLFHLNNTVKIQAFYPVFPSAESIAAESIAKVFCLLFLWNFREKA